MEIARKTRNFLTRHSTKLVVVGGIVGGLYYSLEYMKQMLRDFQENSRKGRWDSSNIMERFERNLEDCKFTVLSLSSELKEQIENEIRVEELVEELKSLGSSKKRQEQEQVGNAEDQEIDEHERAVQEEQRKELERQNGRKKVEIWQSLMLQSFTKIYVIIYCQTLLAILVFTQLSIIGQQLYDESVMEKYEVDKYEGVGTTLDKLTGKEREGGGKTVSNGGKRFSKNEQNYLLLSWYFLNVGWNRVRQVVEEVVKEVVGGITLKTSFTFGEFSKFNQEICTKVNGRLCEIGIGEIIFSKKECQEYLRSNQVEVDESSERYLGMVNQTQDILENKGVVEEVFIRTVERMERMYVEMVWKGGSVEERKEGVVKIVPRIAKEAQVVVLDDDQMNGYMEVLMGSSNEQMRGYAAMIFTATKLQL